MSKSQIFEYACIHQPPKNGKKDDEPRDAHAKLIVDVTRVLAGSEQEATILAARAIPDEYLDKLAEVEIVIRPF